jgi:O-antigen ligase
LGLAVIGAVWFLTSDVVLRQRFSSIGASNDGRLSAWNHLLEVAMQRPFTGYGLGTFSSVHTHFLTTPRFAQADWAWNSPHNLFLQLMLQGGLPYLALLLAAVGEGSAQTIRSLRGRWTRDHVLIVVLLIVLVGCAMVDLVLDMPAPVTLAMFLAGSLWGQAINRPEIGVVAARDDPSRHEPAIGLRASHRVERPVQDAHVVA